MRLSKVEKVYIEARHTIDSPKQIAKDLHLLLADVERYVSKLEQKNREKEAVFVENSVPVQPVQEQNGPKAPTVRELMITKTSEKKSSGVAIMTLSASELADEHSKTARGKTRYDQSTIFVIDPSRKD
jgi:hypothetical protein